MMRIRVATPSCIGSGQCAMTVPEVFDQADDGVVLLIEGQPAPPLHEAVHVAAQRCPVQAISVEEI